MKSVRTPVLDISCRDEGAADAPAVFLMHGFPYSYRCYDEVVTLLTAHGLRVIVPEMRGYGGTRFRSPETPRSGEQASFGADLRDLMDALKIETAVLAGYDWGGRGACIVAALWPQRVRGLVTVNGYNLQNIAASGEPADPVQEQRLWYQYYFNLERGRAGLTVNRRAIAKLLWKLWSPSWRFSDAEFEASAAAFDNPDFVDVVIHSYRHRYGLVAGDPAYAAIEAELAKQPAIAVPTIAIQGADDDVHTAASSQGHAKHFTGRYERRVLDGVGHNPPQEAPAIFAQAVLDVMGMQPQKK
jgi:pimeloyl-ACP methyl ester carboxylesterase